MTDDEQREFCARLKADPESARGMMELAVEILVHQYGAKFTRELVLWRLGRRTTQEPVSSRRGVMNRLRRVRTKLAAWCRTITAHQATAWRRVFIRSSWRDHKETAKSGPKRTHEAP
jgi:hypothetical protein